jgi:hypothetical protein
MTHTPKPWHVDLGTGDITAVDGQVSIGTIYGVDDLPVAEFEDDDDEGIQQWVTECKANALLIGAAPDLLEACKLALAEMKNTDAYMESLANSEGAGNYNPFFVEQIRALEVAITAAEGE